MNKLRKTFVALVCVAGEAEFKKPLKPSLRFLDPTRGLLNDRDVVIDGQAGEDLFAASPML